MKNKLKVIVGAVALVAVALVAVNPGAASGGDAVRTGMAPVEAGFGGAWFDDLWNIVKNVGKRIGSLGRSAPVLGTKLDDVLRQQSWRPTVQRVRAATSRLRSDERVEVVAEACQVMDDLEADEQTTGWITFDEVAARVAEADETVGDIMGGVEALHEVLEAFADRSNDRYVVLGKNVVCQAAELGS